MFEVFDEPPKNGSQKSIFETLRSDDEVETYEITNYHEHTEVINSIQEITNLDLKVKKSNYKYNLNSEMMTSVVRKSNDAFAEIKRQHDMDKLKGLGNFKLNDDMNKNKRKKGIK